MMNHPSSSSSNTLMICRCALVAAAVVTVAQRPSSCEAFAPLSPPLQPLVDHGTHSPSSFLDQDQDRIHSNHQSQIFKITKPKLSASYTPIQVPTHLQQRRYPEDSLGHHSSVIPLQSPSPSSSQSTSHHLTHQRQKKTMQRPTLDSALYPSPKKNMNTSTPQKKISRLQFTNF